MAYKLKDEWKGKRIHNVYRDLESMSQKDIKKLTEAKRNLYFVEEKPKPKPKKNVEIEKEI